MRLVLIALAIYLLPASACAQDTAEDRFHTSAARALFVEGVELARNGAYAEATDRFRRAQALHPAPSVAFNLAAALIHEGALVEAYEILTTVVRDPASTPELRAAATERQNEIAPRIARLTLHITGPAAGVRVEIDRHVLRNAAIGVSVPIDPGTHEVTALRDGEALARDQIELTEGESREVSLAIPRAELLPESILDPTPAEPAPAPPPPNDDALYWAIGVGAVVLVAVVVTTATLAVTLPGPETPVMGNTTPAVLTW